ncbi:MAG: hypothetical protein WCQ00_02470 [bacterium]
MFKAIGLVVLLIAVRVLMPGVFGAMDEAGTKFFHAIGRTADMVDPANFKTQRSLNTAGINYIPKPAPLVNSFQ